MGNAKSFADNLSVRNKGLLIVLIPLVFQVAMSAVLGFLYALAEQQAWRESQGRLLIVRTNNIISDLYSGGQLLVAYTATHSPETMARWQAKKQSLLEELDSTKKLSVGHGSSSLDYERLVFLSNRCVQLIDNCFRRTAQGISYDVFKTFPEVKRVMDTISDQMESVLTDDLRTQVAGVVSEEKTRKLIATCLYCGLAADVLIAIGLSSFFAASIERRLGIISENTRRIREHSELCAPQPGKDEIARVDNQFHELSRELQESERLRSEFISMLSHDLKTPLMSIEFSLELMKRDMPEGRSASTNEEMRSMQQNVRRVMSLILDVLDLERGANGKFFLEIEEIDVATVLSRVVSSLFPLAAQKHVEIVTQTPNELSLFADLRRFEQIVVNLLSNAIKFAPAGTQVIVSASEQGEKVEIRVIDRGVGVAEEDRNRIFERFQQGLSANRSGNEGTGLGLAICKSLVEAHSGEIGYEPNPDGGSQFWFRLPIAD